MWIAVINWQEDQIDVADRPKRKFIFAASGYIYVIGGLLSSLTIWLMDVEQDEKWIEQKPIIWMFIERFQEAGIWGLTIIAIVITATAIVKRMADPWAVEKLQFILDEYQDKVFKNLNAPKDHNRGTLFKFRENLLFRRHWHICIQLDHSIAFDLTSRWR
ncbi:hypothetical protein PUR31_04630 [Pseudomonas mosselii]|uniref:hypothetical protein n=1 Tax=unclassified Pseudomonas TaxID=196821 RepID=UPI0020C3E02A|nr:MULTISPECIES: hypothetical protein [unclassified Pseudomonas]MCP8632909.1 hypothetical protein [Pseudomonas sp. DVZ6]MDD7783380.1 hypothetical protein [Pseudomonas sp. DVZ24]